MKKEENEIEKAINRIYNQMIDNERLTIKLPYMWVRDKNGKIKKYNPKLKYKKVIREL